MSRKSLLKSSSYVALMGLMLALMAGLFLALPAEQVAAGEKGPCEGDKKIEGKYGHVYWAPYGKEIKKVCIKAGPETYTFYAGNPGDGCYKIDWIYDNYGCVKGVCISGGGTSRYCKDISHTTATFRHCDCD